MLTKLEIITPPAALPVNLDTAINHCRVDSEADIQLIEDLYLPTAITYVEDYLNRALITQQLRWNIAETERKPALRSNMFLISLSTYYKDWIELPRATVQSVESVFGSYPGSDTEELFLNVDYNVDLDTDPARLLINRSGKVWDRLTVNYTAGYGTSEAAVPTPIKSAIYLVCSHLYTNRGDVEGEVIGKTVRNLLVPYRITVYE